MLRRSSFSQNSSIEDFCHLNKSKNGVVVGAVYKIIRGPLFPTVAVHSHDEEVHVNFGQKPFAFDLKAFEAKERVKQQTTIEKIPLPPNISYGIIRSYSMHYGYEDTLNSLYLATKNTSTVPVHQTNGFDEADIFYALSQRRSLSQVYDVCHGSLKVIF